MKIGPNISSMEGGLLQVEKQGHHRYYRLVGSDVAAAIEVLMDLVARSDRRHVRPGPEDPEMREARVCYDHLAGERGIRAAHRIKADRA